MGSRKASVEGGTIDKKEGGSITGKRTEKKKTEKSDETDPRTSRPAKRMTPDQKKYHILTLIQECGHVVYHRFGGERGQIRILRILSEEKEIPQKTLQEILGQRAGSVSEIITKLEKKGYVCRIRDKIDKRQIVLSLTNLGRTAFQGHSIGESIKDKRIFQALDDEEIEELRRTLSKLLKSWDELFPEKTP